MPMRTTLPSASGGSKHIGAIASTAMLAWAGSSSVTSSRSPPTRALSSSEVPSAITVP